MAYLKAFVYSPLPGIVEFNFEISGSISSKLEISGHLALSCSYINLEISIYTSVYLSKSFNEESIEDSIL